MAVIYRITKGQYIQCEILMLLKFIKFFLFSKHDA